MTEVRFSPTSYTEGASQTQRSAQELHEATRRLISQVSDLSVLGTNDTLGGVAQMVYGVFLEIFQQIADDLATGIDEQGAHLRAVGEAYAQVEEENTQAAASISGGL